MEGIVVSVYSEVDMHSPFVYLLASRVGKKCQKRINPITVLRVELRSWPFSISQERSRSSQA